MRVTRFTGPIAAAATVLAAVLVAVVITRQPEAPQATPSATPTEAAVASPSASASPAPSAVPSASASPTVPPTPAVASPSPLATVNPDYLETFVPAQTRGVGQLTGDWVFMLRRSTLFGTLPSGQVTATEHAVDSLVLVPLAKPDTGAVEVATFLSNLGGGIVATNLIGAQLSPNGDRLVLSVGTKGPQGGERLGLVIIDLASGNTSNLTTDASYHDDTPAWSPDGNWIAFSRRTVRDGRDAAVWIIATTPGSQPRPLMSPQVNEPGRRTYLYGWTPDGLQLAMTRGHDGIEFADPFFSGRCPATTPVCVPPPMTSFNGAVSGSRDAMDWRAKVPQFVGAFSDVPRGVVPMPAIAVADQGASSLRVIARSPASPGGSFRPRWRPGTNEVLYLESPGPLSPGQHRLMIVDTSAGPARQVVSQPFPMFAEWTPDGSSIAWVQTNGVAVTVRLVRPDGSGERSIYGTGGVPEAQVITVDFGTLRF